MSSNNTIQYTIEWKNDNASFEKIRQDLKAIQQMTQSEYLNLNKGLNAAQASHQLKELKAEAAQLQTALQKAFNSDLGAVNINKLNQELSKLNLKDMSAKFASAGVAGQQAFRDIAAQTVTTNMHLKQTHSTLNEIRKTFVNTLK